MSQMEEIMKLDWMRPTPARPAKPDTLGQRAVKAAEMVSAKRGLGKSRAAAVGIDVSTWVTQEEAAKIVGVSRDSVTNAQFLLTHGTEEQIERVRSGKHTLGSAVAAIKLHQPETRGQAVPPANLERRRTNALVWGQLRSAIEGLAKLPLPRDVAKLARRQKKSGEFVEKQLLKAINWLREFEEEWRREDE